MSNNKGQTLYYFLIFTLVLVISWAMMLNIAKLIRDRMIMQNMADNIALSMATHKARTMNLVGACNDLIGLLLSLGTRPQLIQIPTYSTEYVAAYPYGDRKRNKFHEALEDDVANLKTIVDGVMKVQEVAMQSHLLYVDFLRAKYLTKGYVLETNPNIISPSLENAENIFGLKRNMKGIRYLKTVNLQEGNLPHIVYNPFPISMKDIFIRSIGKANPALAMAVKILELAGYDFDEIFEEIINKLGLGGWLGLQVYEKSDYSWYIIDDEKFYKQKYKVMLRKILDDDNKPLFAQLIGIDSYFLLNKYTRSASAIYNTKGKMFPEAESDKLGMVPGIIVEPALHLVMSLQMLQLFKETRNLINYEPWASIIAAAIQIPVMEYISERNLQKIMASKSDTCPMAAFQEAKTGGWAAHLVPYKISNDDE